jgi:bacillithiol biosynthesis cysteine-adding enzyme BshC
MNYNGRAMASRPPILIDYGAFQQPPSRLFRDYLTSSPAVEPFYGSARWDLEGLQASAESALRAQRPRETVVEALIRQQEAREAPAAAAQARRLRDPRATAIVTGQQAVLFGGPLYVLYKALAAVVVARALEARRGAPVVPVFWVAADDHDFAEIRSTTVLDETGQIHDVRYTPHREPVGQPAARIVLDDTVTEIVEELRGHLPAGLHRDEVLSLVAACYRPGATLSEAFARLLSALLPDLVVLDPSDPALKAAALPVFVRELVEHSPTSRLAAEAGQRLLAAGYHQQVPVRAGFLNLFVYMDGERRAMGWENGIIEVRGLGRKMPVAEAQRALESDPSALSAGVLLRPLTQDHLLPTAAYVGGPRRSRITPRSVRRTLTSGFPGPCWCRGRASLSSSPPRPGPWKRTRSRCPTCRRTRKACSRGGRARTIPRWTPPSARRGNRSRRRWRRSKRSSAPSTPR